MAYYCPKCGEYITDGTYHACGSSWIVYPQSNYNYKCPDCNGEFNTPAYPEGYTGTTKQYKCPFCGRTMEGLNQ